MSRAWISGYPQSKKYYHDGKQLKLFCGCVNIEYIYSYTTKANGKIIETKSFLCYKLNFKIQYRVSGEAFLTRPNKTTYMIQNIIKKITKIKPKLSTTGGTSDARFIRKIAPCLEFGLVGKTMHKVDEAVSISDLKKLTKIYSEILKNYF